MFGERAGCGGPRPAERVDQQDQAATRGVFDVVRTAVARVRQAVRAHDIPDSAVHASQLNLASSWQVAKGERVFEAYACSVSFSIELSEVNTLESVLVDLVEAGVDQVDRVEFDVRAKPRLRAEARSAAVAAAREKAARYAVAAGVRLGPVAHFKDVDPNLLRGHRSNDYHAASAGEDGYLLPGNVSVSAGVVLGCSLVAA